MSDARAAILERVRAALAADPERRSTPPPLPAVLASPPVPAAERHERFRTTLERVGGRVERVASLAMACERVLALARERRVQQVAVSDAPELEALVARLLPEVEVALPVMGRAGLLESGMGVSRAQWGIAETGTLVLESARERHRLVSLLPPVHVALLSARTIVGTLGEALAAVRSSSGAPASRTITFVTGPSRTADIELTLVVGVHGPRELHVLVHD